jgi:two-component system, LytTR family, sensor histidine kinase AlgZ
MRPAERIRRVCDTYWLRIAVVSGATALVMTSVHVAFGRLSVLETLVHALVYALCLGGLAGLILPVARHRVRNAGLAVEWTVTIVLLLAVAVAGTWLSSGILGVLGLGYGQSLAKRFAAALWVNAVLTEAVGVAIMVYEAQRSRLERVGLEARLTSLESRLHPHFLFNTLNAISALIQEDPDRAERTVERLAALLRFSLDATERGLVPLTHELKIVTDYLEIEKARLGERLAYTIEVAPDVQACEVPPLAIQTLVENSITHAIAPRTGGGRLRVTGSTRGATTTLEVWDDGPGFTEAAIRDGHGLDNLKARLAGRFGSAATLAVARRDGGTLVSVSMPRNGARR